MPNQGYGFTRNPKLFLGPPSLKAAIFPAAVRRATGVIKLRYPLNRAGFGGQGSMVRMNHDRLARLRRHDDGFSSVVPQAAGKIGAIRAARMASHMAGSFERCPDLSNPCGSAVVPVAGG